MSVILTDKCENCILKSDMLPIPTQSNAAALKERGTEEVRQRKVGEDPRRQIFSIQHKLLSQLEPKFGQMYLDDMEKLLAKHPYDDGGFADKI